MIDNVTLKLPYEAVRAVRAQMKDARRIDENTSRGRIGSFDVHQNIASVHLHGSLAKYLKGENVSTLVRNQVKSAIDKLEADTGLDLSSAIVQGLEVGATIKTKESPKNYMKLFDMTPVYTRQRFERSAGLETVLYTTNTGAFEFIAYDKRKEAEKHNMPIPELFQTGNMLRLEYKIRNRRGIQAKFDRELFAHDLYEHDAYRQLQKLFYDFYRSIPKMGRRCFVDLHEGVTPAQWEKLLAEQYRQSCPQDYLETMQALRASGAINAKSYERIREQDKQRGRDASMSITNPLIDELDGKVHMHAINGA
jgi:hypothetical protein